ncbi:BTAD domain-containing putative transcriptional regulator, partial [Streptomyces sp. CBMA291]
GRAAEALPELTALCAARPLDEPLQALRIRALRDTGRAAEALAAYETFRRALSTRLGTDPSPALRTLHAELLTGSGATPEDTRHGNRKPPNPPRERLQPRGPHPEATTPHGTRPSDPAPLPKTAPYGTRSSGSGSVSEAAPYGARPTDSGSLPEAAPYGTRPSGSGPLPEAAPYGARPSGSGPFPEAAPYGARPTDSGPFPEATPYGTRPPGSGPLPEAAPYETRPEATPYGTRPPVTPAVTPSPTAADPHAPCPDPGPRPDPLPGIPGVLPGPAPYGTRPPGSPEPEPTAAHPPTPHQDSIPGPAPHEGPIPGPAPHQDPIPGSAPSPGQGPFPERPGNLRARLTSFVGRDEEIAALQEDLRVSRLVTLLGPGGAGKTRLSQEAAERGAQAGGWPDGVWVAELAAVTDPEAVTEAVLVAVGARETVLRGAGAEELRTGDDPLARLAEHCANRRMLLLLDNCEHLVGAAAALAETLLARCPGLRVLATSREPLGVPGETLRPLGPLPESTALRLLGERGAAARPGFRVADDPEAAAEIVRRLDGLPLAVELAAARLRLLTPRQIADRLDDRFRLLTSGSRTVLPRQQTLRAVVDWSWDLLDAAERAVLRRLAVFTGGCDLEAAEAVCGDADAAGDSGVPTAPAALDVLDALGSLVDKSLVVATPDGTGMRFRLLETVAEYARERLAEAGERTETERRHLTYYRELARRTDPELRGRGQLDAIARFGTEYGNLRTALRRAVDAGEEDEALLLVHSLLWYWQMRDLRTDALHWSRAVAALGPDPFASPTAPVVPLHEPCTAAPPPLSEEQRWEARRGVRLVELINMNHETGRWTSPEGNRRLREMTAVYGPGLPQTCRLPGSFAFFAVLLVGEPGRMRELLDTTVEACRTYGYEWDLANALQLRANVFANRGDLAGEGIRDADESLAIFVGLGDAWGAAEALSSRAEARERRLEFEESAADFAAAIGYTERIGAQAQTALLRARYAGTLVETGRLAEAEAILREILDGAHGRSQECLLGTRMFLGLALGRGGRTAEAREHFLALRRDFDAEALSLFEGFTLGALAWLDALDGRYASALGLTLRAYGHSLSPMLLAVAPQLPANHLVIGAWALAGLGGPSARTGAVLLGASAGLLPPGHLSPPAEAENLERATALARSVLGEDAFAAAYAEGDGLSREEAAALLGRAVDAIGVRAES